MAAESGQTGYRNGCGDPLPGLRPLTATGNKDKLLIESLEPLVPYGSTGPRQQNNYWSAVPEC